MGHMVGLRNCVSSRSSAPGCADCRRLDGAIAPQRRFRHPPDADAEKVRKCGNLHEAIFRVVDREKTEVRWQSEWFGNFSLADVIN